MHYHLGGYSFSLIDYLTAPKMHVECDVPTPMPTSTIKPREISETVSLSTEAKVYDVSVDEAR
jgi:hypothetical protein